MIEAAEAVSLYRDKHLTPREIARKLRTRQWIVRACLRNAGIDAHATFTENAAHPHLRRLVVSPFWHAYDGRTNRFVTLRTDDYIEAVARISGVLKIAVSSGRFWYDVAVEVYGGRRRRKGDASQASEHFRPSPSGDKQ